jgi:HSP20 family protein
MLTSIPLNSVLNRMVTLSRALDDSFAVERDDQTNGTPQQFWVPGLDAYETENAFVVKLDLPGVSVENVDLGYERNTLTVRGTRGPTLQAPENGEMRVFFAERATGSFQRSLRLPQFVDAERIEAAMDNGVLTITIPKAASAQPRKISINQK